MARLPLTELRERLTDAVHSVAYRGERLLIEKNGKPIAALVSLEDFAALERFDKEEARDITSSGARRGEPRTSRDEVERDLDALDPPEEAEAKAGP